MRLKIAQVAPVATTVPPPRSGSIETLTAILADGLVDRGHDVTLFATEGSRTKARLHAIIPRGYNEDAELWPWEQAELFNIAAAVERADDFDVIHCQAEYYPMSLAFVRLTPTPVLQTLHHLPAPVEVARWGRYAEAPFTAVSAAQARVLSPLNIVGTVHHAIDVNSFAFQPDPDDYLLFLGRFMPGKGVLQAIEIARRAGMRLVLAAARNEYFDGAIAPLVDGRQVVYAGELEPAAKVALLGGARALLYPIQAPEAFGLVLAEAQACGTPVAALNVGAVPEVVADGVGGCVFDSLDALVAGLSRVLALDRARVRANAEDRFGIARMVDGYIHVYERLVAARRFRAS
jgi:glycosyltransferase involved in cell wall biosynthesis